MIKKSFIILMDILILSVVALFFFSLSLSGELLVMFIMGVFVMGTLNAYWQSRKKYLYGCK
jgi:hypothetical protein